MLVTLVNFSLALFCVRAPALIERAGMTRRGAIILSFLNMLAWVPLVIAFLLSRLGVAPAWFAIFWFVNLAPAMLLSVQRDSWLSGLVPRASLGRYLGQRLAIKSAFYLGGFILLGYLLDVFGGESLTGFAFIFVLAMGAALVDFIIFTFMNDSRPQDDRAKEPAPDVSRFGMGEYIGELKARKLGNFISFTSLFYFSVGLSGPLYAVYMFQDLHFSYLSFTMIISAEYFARVVSVPFWGRLADRVGNIRVLAIVTRVIPVVPLAWLFSSNMGYLAFVQVASGICWGAYDLCTQSYLYRMAPPEKKLRYIIYTRSLVLLATAAGGLLGALLVNDIFSTFGSPILTVFLVSGFFRAGVVLLLMPGLVDLAVSHALPARRLSVNLDGSGGIPASKRGLYYFRHLQPAPVPVGKEAFRMKGRPVPEAKAPGPRSKGPHREAGRRGWYCDPEMRAAQAPARPHTMKTKIATGRASLYHDPAGWSSYLKESFLATVREAGEWKEAAARRRPRPLYDFRALRRGERLRD